MAETQIIHSRSLSDRQPRILLVDDENAVRDSLYALLEEDGYEVLAAKNGADGLEIFRQSIRPIRLLLTDYNMPRMSGVELARECSRLSCELCVLYISGSRPDEALQADLAAPKRAFLAKPFRGDDLLQKVRELLLLRSPDRASTRADLFPPDLFPDRELRSAAAVKRAAS
jgi:CheY-like chemotaxis protein